VGQRGRNKPKEGERSKERSHLFNDAVEGEDELSEGETVTKKHSLHRKETPDQPVQRRGASPSCPPYRRKSGTTCERKRSISLLKKGRLSKRKHSTGTGRG